MAAPSIASSAAYSTGGSGTTFVESKPTGVVSGDLLIAYTMGIMATPGTVSAESGWTQILQTSGLTQHQSVWWKVAGSSEPSTYTFTSTQTVSQRSGGIYRITGMHPSTPIGVNALNSGTSNTSAVGSAVTAADNDSLLLLGIFAQSNVTIGDVTGMTQVLNPVGRCRTFQQGVNSGSTGTRTSTLSASSNWSTTMVVIRPVPASAPSVALDTADDSELSNTPALQFTGTSGGDPITYQIQISTSDSFNPASVMTDDVNYPDSPVGGLHPNPLATFTWNGQRQVDDRFAQSFTAAGGVLDKIAIAIGIDEAEVDGSALVRVYAHQGTFGTSSEPLNAADPEDTPTPGWLAESESMAITEALASAWYEFDFVGDERIYLQPGTHYVMCCDWLPTTGVSTNTIELSSDTTPTHSGNAYVDGDSANNGVRLDFDVFFAVFEIADQLDKVSDTNAGFSGSPDNSDPFASGQQVTFTVQSGDELIAGAIYYWRVRGIDPGGTNTYGSWSETRQFTVEEAATNYTLTADSGTFTLTGQAATLRATRLITAAAGSFALTGQTVGLRVARLLTAASGSYSLTGQSATLRIARRLAATLGTLALTGIDANLIYTPASGYVLAADSGAYALAGQAAPLLYGHRLIAAQGIFAITGQNARLLIGYLFTVSQGAFTLSGQAIVLLVVHQLVAGQGAYVLSGQSAMLLWSGQVAPETPLERIFAVAAENRVYVVSF